MPNRTAVCIALRTLVEECTVILGHCYSPKQVEETKRKQRILMNEAIKKILPGLNLEEDCSSYTIPNNRFIPDRSTKEDQDVEYHPLQFGLSSEQRDLTTKGTTPTESLDSSTEVSRSTVGSSASKIPTAFLKPSISTPSISNLPATTAAPIAGDKITISPDMFPSSISPITETANVHSTTTKTASITISGSVATSPGKEIFTSTTGIVELSSKNINMTESMPPNEDRESPKRAVQSTTSLSSTLALANTTLRSTPDSAIPETTILIENKITVNETTTSTISGFTKLTDVTTIASDPLNFVQETEVDTELPTLDDSTLDIISDLSSHGEISNITLPGELLFSTADYNLTHPRKTEVDPSKSNLTPETVENLLQLIKDDNDVTLTRRINVNSESVLVNFNNSSKEDKHPEAIVPSTVFAKTSTNVNDTHISSVVTDEPMKNVTKYDIIPIGVEPNIAQPISSKKQENLKENNASIVRISKLFNVIFTLSILKISLRLIS